jgi:hypothetical protein
LAWQRTENKRVERLVQNYEKSIVFFRNRLKFQDIEKFGGSAILVKHYNNSPTQMLSTLYPEYDWLPWKFVQCPRNFWSDKKNHRKFLDWASEQLKIKDKNDWYTTVPQV